MRCSPTPASRLFPSFELIITLLVLDAMFLKKLLVLALLLPLAAVPAWAQSAPIKLSLGFARQEGVLSGATNGSYSLSSVAKFDAQRNPCLGFATNTPSHTVVLGQSFPKLNFQVNSRGKDTTLVVRMPNGQVLCGDDTGTSKDASVNATNLPAGEYAVWVGSIDPGKRWSYGLTITEK
jgi:hypothetical protein